MRELKALLFDVDGTLADTERDGHRVAFNKAFSKAGLDWNWSVDVYGQLLEVTGGKERIKHYVKNFLTDFNPPDLDDLAKQLHESKTEFYLELLKTGKIPLRPGVKRLIKQAHDEGMRMAITTTTTYENVTTLLEQTMGPEAIRWFEVIGAGDVVPNKKPAPDIYTYVLDKMKLSPDECLAFEDSHNGICATRAAHLETVIVVNGYTFDHDFDGALVVLDNFGEPDRKFTVIEGDVGDFRFVDLEFLRFLHNKPNAKAVGE